MASKIRKRKNVKGMNKMHSKRQFKMKEYKSDDEEEEMEAVENEMEVSSLNVNKENSVGNEGWADAMSRILGKSVSSKKMVVLARAKTEQASKRSVSSEKSEDRTDLNKEAEKEETTNGKEAEGELSYTSIRQKHEKRKNWESLGRKKIDITEKEYERNLTRIATRGVVQLFNAVQQQQKTLDTKLKTVGASETKRDEVVKKMDKGTFLDILKGTKTNSSKQRIQQQDTNETSSSWSALRDDFMLGAKMKDWDKEEDEISVQ